MPVHDGFATARVLRRLSATRDTILIAYTALVEDYVRQRDSRGALDAYCQKGAPLSTLLALIDDFRKSGERSLH